MSKGYSLSWQLADINLNNVLSIYIQVNFLYGRYAFKEDMKNDLDYFLFMKLHRLPAPISEQQHKIKMNHVTETYHSEAMYPKFLAMDGFWFKLYIWIFLVQIQIIGTNYGTSAFWCQIKSYGAKNSKFSLRSDICQLLNQARD